MKDSSHSSTSSSLSLPYHHHHHHHHHHDHLNHNLHLNYFHLHLTIFIIIFISIFNSYRTSNHHSFLFWRSRIRISAHIMTFKLFLSRYRKIPKLYFKIDHHLFLPNPLQFIIHNHRTIRRYITQAY